MATVIENRAETHNIKTFRVRFDDEEKMKNFTSTPDRWGSSPFSAWASPTFVINSSPPGWITSILVMKPAKTPPPPQAQCRDKIACAPRSATGPLRAVEGKNVFFIGGGIGMAPIRTIMVYCWTTARITATSPAVRRQDPCDLSFQSDMPELLERKDLNVTLTIDNPADGLGAQGRPHPQRAQGNRPQAQEHHRRALRPADHDQVHPRGPRRTGFPDDQIYTTLEKRMKCASHLRRCNIGGKLVCVDGPVFSNKQLIGTPPSCRWLNKSGGGRDPFEKGLPSPSPNPTPPSLKLL